jgi:hypothetical protein
VRRLLISFDLRKPGRDYAALDAAIKAIALGWCHCLGSVWVITTTLDCAAARDRLQQHVDLSDGLVVVAIGGEWAAFGLDQTYTAWLAANL